MRWSLVIYWCMNVLVVLTDVLCIAYGAKMLKNDVWCKKAYIAYIVQVIISFVGYITVAVLARPFL